MKEKIKEYFSNFNFDLRKSHYSCWIDQKCTPDVICIIADCIINYLENDRNKEFTVKDIWNSDYSIDIIESIFRKPGVDSEASSNEYDKFFSQPIKLLAYSQVLSEEHSGHKNYYKLKNYDLLDYISIRDRNALDFLILYIEKVLKDSNLLEDFNIFFEVQTKESYLAIKQRYINFIKNNTDKNGSTEISRIFTKVINPLAFKFRKCGTENGRISNSAITYDMLLYNRLNWRDSEVAKPKNITRKEFEQYMDIKNDNILTYNVDKAKRRIKQFNDRYRDGLSEMKINGEYPSEKATQMHHIFPQNEYPTIANYLENIIALTPNQHYLEAHPDNNTQYINVRLPIFMCYS